MSNLVFISDTPLGMWLMEPDHIIVLSQCLWTILKWEGSFSHGTFGHIDFNASKLQPGRYIAYLYDDNWCTGIIMDRCDENNDVKVKFMRHDRLCFSWFKHDNQC